MSAADDRIDQGSELRLIARLWPFVRPDAWTLLLAVVLYPLVSPAILCGVVATRDLFNGADLAGVMDWVRMLAIFDLIFIGGGVALLGPLLAD